MLRIDWPRSAAEGDSTPAGQIPLMAPFSMPRNTTSTSAARPISSVRGAFSARACCLVRE